jgi:4-hydroxybenzoate polyprenyltransferase
VITRPVALTALGAAALTALGAAGVATGSGRRLGFDTVDPWLVVFALGLAVLFAAAAFGFHDVASRRTDDQENRWERALGMWGALTAAAAAGFVLLGLASGFDAATAAGAIAITGLFECALILGALIALVLGT